MFVPPLSLQKLSLTLFEIYSQFVTGLRQTGAVEFIAVVSGITSVYFSQKENIWVFPSGLISTLIYIYLSMKGHLLGEASVNTFYTIMSIYGWILWARKDKASNKVLIITYSTKKEWLYQLLFFAVLYFIIYFLLSYLKRSFAPGAIPAADAFASASAYTGMLLMAKKKIENWIWWIVTNTASIPLYFVKGYVFTSFQFIVFLIMAFVGLRLWQKKVNYGRG